MKLFRQCESQCDRQTNKCPATVTMHCNEAVFNVVQFPENRILWGSFRKTFTNVGHYPIVQIVQSQGVTGYTAFIVEKYNLPFPYLLLRKRLTSIKQ